MFGIKGMGNFWVRTGVSLFFLTGCAKVSIDSQRPIKLDVTMRLDIYQHVTQDVKAIEDMVSSPKEGKEKAAGKTSFLSFGFPEAFAEEEGDFPSGVKEAIDRRKDRRTALLSWESQAALGENADGFVVMRDSSLLDVQAAVLVDEENNDRRIIYQYVSQKNGATLEETGRIFAKRIQEDASSGTPIQVRDETGGLKWMKK